MIVRCRLIAAVLCIVVQVSQAMDLATMVEILRQRTLNNNVNNQTQGPTIQPSDVNQLSEYLLPGGDLEDMIDPEDVPVQVRLVIPPGDLGFSSNELRFGLSVRKSASSRSSEWGEFSCCRQGLNLQSRERMVSDRVMELDKRQCSDNYCESCFDDRPTCRLFKTQIRACHPSSSYRPFMSRHCPETCDMCSATTTTAETTTVNTEETTTEATADPNLVRVNIHYNDVTAPHLYMYSASQSRPRSPWKPVSRSSYVGEVTSFQ
uniref:ShKT domain-containing protein n=3 Tax=Ciona intestinalis TaxID=7719 RepID=F6QNP4_CIOIN